MPVRDLGHSNETGQSKESQERVDHDFTPIGGTLSDGTPPMAADRTPDDPAVPLFNCTWIAC
jgi:hypothetical protein